MEEGQLVIKGIGCFDGPFMGEASAVSKERVKRVECCHGRDDYSWPWDAAIHDNAG